VTLKAVSTSDKFTAIAAEDPRRLTTTDLIRQCKSSLE
jgi:hypothetical protein